MKRQHEKSFPSLGHYRQLAVSLACPMNNRPKTTRGRVSPPPLKRQRRASTLASSTFHEQSTEPFTSTPGTLRIFSWNVNGIAPFIQDYFQKPISAFFKPASVAGKRRRRGSDDGESNDDVTADSQNEEASELARIEDPATEGKASLRLALRRYRWPHILVLQEVKIKPDDAKTMAAVRAAVNDVYDINELGRVGPIHKRDNEVVSESTESSYDARLQDGGPTYEVRFALPSDPHNAKGFGGKIYGVATIIRKDFMDRYVQSIREVAWDREGRVQVVETREVSFPLATDSATSPWPGPETLSVESSSNSAKFGIKLAIINIYAVNGTNNPYYNTYTGTEAGTRHDRKIAVHTELLQEAHALQRRGFQVIIAGDLNVARNELDGYPNLRTYPHQHVLNRIDFNTKFFTQEPIKNTSSGAMYSRDPATVAKEAIPGFDGIDTFRHLHGSERRYSYYPRTRSWGASCDRVDLIITSGTLSGFVVAAGICDNPKDRGPSDHCPVWAEIGRYTNGARPCV